MNVQADHRQRILRALGVTPYGLRARFRPNRDVSRSDGAEAAVPGTVGGTPACVLVLPGDCDARQRAQVDRIMQALGGVFAQAPRVHAVAGELPAPVAPAQAYLAFGEAQARALGRSLPADVMTQAEVLLLDAPGALFQAGGKRRLWQAVGGLRRHWRAAADRRE